MPAPQIVAQRPVISGDKQNHREALIAAREETPRRTS